MDYSDEDVELDDVEEDVEILRTLPLPQREMLMGVGFGGHLGVVNNEDNPVVVAPRELVNYPQNSRSVSRCSCPENDVEDLMGAAAVDGGEGDQQQQQQDGRPLFHILGLRPEEEEFEWPSDRPHPLLSSHIIRDIINNLGPKEVETCRKVSKEWNYEACKVLQEKKVVVLLDYDAVRFYIQCNEDTEYFPHTQFELQLDNISENQPPMREFWTRFGCRIKSLDLRVNSLTLETLFKLLTERLPNLERLGIKNLPRSGNQSRRNSSSIPSSSRVDPGIVENSVFPNIKELGFCFCVPDDGITKTVVKDFLRSMPNLQKLSISDNPSEPASLTDSENSNKSRFARNIICVLMENDIALYNLQDIDFALRVGDNELQMLARNRFPLKSLVLYVRNNTKSSWLKDALLAMSPTLKKLEIVFPEGYFAKGIAFPPVLQMKPNETCGFLKNCRDLKLRKFQGSLEYLQTIRTLKRLIFVDCVVEYQLSSNEFQNSLGMNLSTKAQEHFLEEYVIDSTMNYLALLNVSSLFPMLRKLHLKGLTDDGLGIVYRNLPYLVELEITEGKVTDQGISGVPMEVCVDMAETVMYNAVQPEKYRRDLFIGSLQYLSVLKLSGDDVTDVSIAFGIVDCKNLTRLTLECSKVTDTGIIKIADRMCNQLKYLHIGFCEDVSEAGKFYAREKIKGVKIIVEPVHIKYTSHVCNPFRQIGFPNHVRHLESHPLRSSRVREMLVVIDGEYAFPPLNQERDRMMMAALERRRRASRQRHRRLGGDNHQLNQELVQFDQGVGFGGLRAGDLDEDESDITESSDEDMDMAGALQGPIPLFDEEEEDGEIEVDFEARHAEFDFPLGAAFPEDFGLQD